MLAIIDEYIRFSQRWRHLVRKKWTATNDENDEDDRKENDLPRPQ